MNDAAVKKAEIDCLRGQAAYKRKRANASLAKAEGKTGTGANMRRASAAKMLAAADELDRRADELEQA